MITMPQNTLIHNRQSLLSHGIRNANAVWWDLSTPALYEHALQRREGRLAHMGPLVVSTGQYTGRSPNDKYLVEEPSSHHKIWWGRVNQPISIERFDALRSRLMAYLQGKDIYVQDCYVGADENYRLPIRIITETAWHSLFARNMFLLERDPDRLAVHQPQFTVIDAPGFNANPEEDGTRSEVFVAIHFGRREVIIGGTMYAGEIKKSVFTVMNYLLPEMSVLPMHCSANFAGSMDDVAIFFGLSGTGKTTLSADRSRTLIGDDEHGWSDQGVFNFEGGCYAKVIRLSPEGEPDIFGTTRRFGTILENVAMDPVSRRLDLNSSEFTENTRASYPVSYISNATREGRGGQPKNVVMLTADAFGVLPPLARLTPQQAMYHFLSGYTAKVAGTERGITEPKATFSACFGAPFMALNPVVYARMLGDRIAGHHVKVWLINTGWSGGPYGKGSRVKLAYTRAMVHAALNGGLDGVSMEEDPVFGLAIPERCPGVPAEILDPRSTWEDTDAYDGQARKLASMFHSNFRQFVVDVEPEIAGAGPKLGI
jgi:phosphoenolpyruvate carboxykinase (ATP)